MIKLRPVTMSDLDRICDHRREMFREAGKADHDLAKMAVPFAAWLGPRLADGRYFGFMAQTGDGEAIGGVGLMEIDWPPHPAHPEDCRRGYVLNVFVEPSYRGQGVARALMEASEAAFQERGVTYAILHSTDAGRPCYEQMDWSPTTEMAKHFS
ncbi:GNAT family N-acetyltransferase [Sphingomonas sanguinis]|uniref:GNAT family N-acetyltransferase n=1 Tax=Sphingomonas sanguinis TaxID=33051 RepID=UPI00077BC80F|nr:GNAT family N-acetyltransferase [Sphingomonas sanguinis]